MENGVKLEEYSDEIAGLIPGLLSFRIAQRSSSRNKIEQMGASVLPEVHKMTRSKNKQLQWEAAKILENLANPQSIDVLLDLLENEESDIRWIATEGLVKIGRRSIVPVLIKIIEKGSESLYVQNGTRFVLKRLFTKEERNNYKKFIHALKNTKKTSVTLPSEAIKIIPDFTKKEYTAE